MNRLFWGLFFVLLDYEVTVGTAVFEVLPDFVGFYLMMKGMEQLAEKSARFDRGRHWSFALAVAVVILYGANMMDPDAMTRVWLWAAGLAVLAVTLVLIRWIVLGIQEMGQQIEQLKSMWLILAVLLPICYLANWIPLVGSICGGAAMVTAALFLVSLWDTKQKYLKKSAE